MNDSTVAIPGFQTQGGVTLDLQLTYAMYGELSAARDNAILVLTSYAAQHDDATALFAASPTLDLSRYCVIVINMFCNGLSRRRAIHRARMTVRAFPPSRWVTTSRVSTGS